MSDTVRIFVYRENGKTFAYTLDFFRQYKLESEEDVKQVYGEDGAWEEVEFVEDPDGSVERDIKALARDSQTFLIDDALVPAARAQAMVVRWTFRNAKGEPIPANRDGYLQLKKRVCDIIDANIIQRLYGGSVDANFLKYAESLKSNSPTSGAEKGETGRTSTKE